jgi:hypothetical protein
MKPEMQRFNEALRGILRVSKGDLAQILAREKKEKSGMPKRGPKPKASVHASPDKA